MSFQFKTEKATISEISEISDGSTSSIKTPEPQISGNSDVRIFRDNIKRSNNNNDKNIRSTKAANPANSANRLRLFNLCSQATDGIKLIDGRRLSPTMFIKRLTADDVDGILSGDYGVPLLRCAAESMAKFPREFES